MKISNGVKRDYRLYINDILEAIKKIEKYTKGINFEEFSRKDVIVDAVMRNFTIIGEAVKQIPTEIKQKYPNVSWREMAGMRDKLVHEYFGVNLEILWKTIKEDLPSAKPFIEEVMRKMRKKN